MKAQVDKMSKELGDVRAIEARLATHSLSSGAMAFLQSNAEKQVTNAKDLEAKWITEKSIFAEMSKHSSEDIQKKAMEWSSMEPSKRRRHSTRITRQCACRLRQ
eukprot:547468-Pyramimonas_sp.AAC.1